MTHKPGENLFSIRPATPDDYDRILKVWQQSGLSIRLQGRDRREEYERQLIRFGDCFLVAEIDGEIIGTVLGTHDERKGWINRLAVVPRYQGQGVASSLIHACEKAIHQCGIDIIAALIEPDNQASNHLFEKLNYQTDVPVKYFRKLRHPDV